MINKQSFVDIMNTLRDYDDKLRVLYNEFGIGPDNNIFTDVLDNIMEAITDDVEMGFEYGQFETPWCYYFAYELNWGRADNAATATAIDGETVPLTSAEELYDLLLMLRNKE